MQRRRGIFQRILGAIDRLMNVGGGAEQAPSPSPEETQPTYEQYEQFEPLPSQPQELPPPPQQVEEEVTITEVTPTFSMGDNTEYKPGHMSGPNGKNPVYGRWRVTDPELGDISDIINKVPQGRITVVVCGQLEIYVNTGVHGPGCRNYIFETEDIQDLLDSQIDSEGHRIEFVQDLVNELLVRDNTTFSSVSEFNILNKEDDPRVQGL
jgi:hypothetical protein